MPEVAVESGVQAINAHAIAVMLLTVSALYLFTRERMLSQYGDLFLSVSRRR